MSMKKIENSGVFITLEGADGLGKSTLYKRVVNSLKQGHFKVATFDYPNKSGTPIGDLIGDFLNGGYGDISPEFLSLAFAIDRLDSKEKLIHRLNRGEAVFSDRYVQSNIVYQSAKLSDETRIKQLASLIEWLEFEVFGLPKPDIEIILVAPDYHYTSGAYKNRDIDLERKYVTINTEGDVHETKLDLQLKVNDIYKILPEKDGRFTVDIYHNDGLTRKTKDELFDEVSRFL